MSNARCRDDETGRATRLLFFTWLRCFGECIFSASRIAFALACITITTALSVGNAVAQGAPAGGGAGAGATPPALTIKCLIVHDSSFGGSLSDPGTAGGLTLGTGDGTNDPDCQKLFPPKASPTDATSNSTKDSPIGTASKTSGPLTGAGDLVVAVDKDEFTQAQEALQSTPGAFVLYLNGVPLPHDATLEAAEQVGSLIALRYRIHQGPEVQRLWSMLYTDGHLFSSQPLYASLGWQASNGSGATQIPVRSDAKASVRITTGLQLTLALLLVAATIGVVIYTGNATDTLRDAATPAWWSKAKRTQRVLAGLSNADRDAYLAREYPGGPSLPAYQPANRKQYDGAAESALAGNIVDESQAAQVMDTICGLALRTDRWKPVRGTFSLSRTQLALWFAFTVATGLFLWLLYGELRRIDGSLLVLLGISVGTAGVSWISDRTVDGRPYEPSAGFWADLITGFDGDQKQLYRYQAVVVNLLLLLVGIYHVAQQLAYPVFDPSWLIFLGISGSTYGIGKQLVETK